MMEPTSGVVIEDCLIDFYDAANEMDITLREPAETLQFMRDKGWLS